MFKGKATCEILKSVRKTIADANGIDYQPTECKHQGDCGGTCPKCEAESRYIENQLSLRKVAGKAVKIVGIATGVSALCVGLPSCDQWISGDVPDLPTEYFFNNETDHDIEIQMDSDTIRIEKGKNFHFRNPEGRAYFSEACVVYDDSVSVRFDPYKSVVVDGKELNFLNESVRCFDDFCTLSYTFTDEDYQYALAHKDDVEEEEKQHLIRPIPTDSTETPKND